MLIKISLVVAMCSGVSMDAIKQKMAELTRQNPGAKITLRVDQKATCSKSADE